LGHTFAVKSVYKILNKIILWFWRDLHDYLGKGKKTIAGVSSQFYHASYIIAVLSSQFYHRIFIFIIAAIIKDLKHL